MTIPQFLSNVKRGTVMFYSKEMVDFANSIAIVDILRQIGEPVKRVGSYYCTLKHDSLRIKDNHFAWYSREIKGYTIKFFMEYFNLSFLSAVELILNSGTICVAAEPSTALPLPRVFVCPKEAQDKRRAIAYLCKSRMLSYDVVCMFAGQGIIGQEENGNVLFKALTYTDKKYVGGEIRSTAPQSSYRRIMTGSDCNCGVNICIGDVRNAYFFESAIDMLSFYELYRRFLKDSILVSLAGLKYGPIESVLQTFRISATDCCICTDADSSGEQFFERCQQKQFGFKRMRPKYGCKDWNEALCRMKQPMAV